MKLLCPHEVASRRERAAAGDQVLADVGVEAEHLTFIGWGDLKNGEVRKEAFAAASRLALVREPVRPEPGVLTVWPTFISSA